MQHHKIYGLTAYQYAVFAHKTKSKLLPHNNLTIGKYNGKSISTNTKTTSLNKLDCKLMIDIFNITPYYEFGTNTEDIDSCLLPRPVDDILHGIARLDLGGNTRPLRKTLIYELITLNDCLYMPDIERYLNVQLRQAQRYMKACKLAVLCIEREYTSGRINKLELYDRSDEIIESNDCVIGDKLIYDNDLTRQ